MAGVVVKKQGEKQKISDFKKLLNEELEDARDIKLTQERMKNYDPSRIISREEFMKKIGITQSDIDACGGTELE